MKLKYAKIIIRTASEIKDEWKNSIKGKIKIKQREDEIIFTGFDTLSKIFSKERLEIFKIILDNKPKSVHDLAGIVRRDFISVYSDVKFLSEIGLIELHDAGDTQKLVMPVAKFSGIELDLAA